MPNWLPKTKVVLLLQPTCVDHRLRHVIAFFVFCAFLGRRGETLFSTGREIAGFMGVEEGTKKFLHTL